MPLSIIITDWLLLHHYSMATLQIYVRATSRCNSCRIQHYQRLYRTAIDNPWGVLWSNWQHADVRVRMSPMDAHPEAARSRMSELMWESREAAKRRRKSSSLPDKSSEPRRSSFTLSCCFSPDWRGRCEAVSERISEPPPRRTLERWSSGGYAVGGSHGGCVVSNGISLEAHGQIQVRTNWFSAN